MSKKNLKTLKDFSIVNKRILARCDFNVPLSETGKILDDFRIKKTIPFIDYIIKNKGKLILIAHLGRPNLKSEKFFLEKKKYSLKPISLSLEKLLKRKIKFLDNCIGREVEKNVRTMKQGEIILLENLRFYKQETENDQDFAQKLSKLGDIFVQEAFGTCHRNHTSITGIPKHLPSCIGFLMEQEIQTLSKLRDNPKKPLLTIIGGKKAKTKTKLINKISENSDNVLIGHLIQKQIIQEKIKLKYPYKIVPPLDSSLFGKDLDIGHRTIALFRQKITNAKTIFWNGQLGKTEEKKFRNGSLIIARAIISSGAYSIIGGGDTIAFLNKYNLRDKFNFVSTGGGAMLAFLSGESLPGIVSLRA